MLPSPNRIHGSYRFDDLLFKDFSRTFQGLSTIFKESISTRTISHFSSYSKKAISVSANNVIQPKDRIIKNYSFSFSSMELNFLSKETRSLSLSYADRLKAFAWVTKPNEDNVTAFSPSILLLFLCLSLFMCDFNADSPMFEMSIIRSQHLHKAFFLSALNAVNQPLYFELSSHCRL